MLSIPVGVLTQNLGQASATAKEPASDGSFLTKYKDRIEVIKLSGMIIEKADSGLLSSSTGSATSTLKDLRKAAKNDKVKAVLLRINSPGGTVPTSQEIYEAVKELRKKGKPVVVSMGDMAASGGYYIACAADKIYANPGTLTGSIGVIMNLMNFKTLADKIGVEPDVVKSGLYKDIASPYHRMTKDERQILTDLIMDSYDQFTQAVSEGRKLPIEEVKRIADGRVYSGRQALKLKLVDELGTYSDALNSLQKTCREKYHLKNDLAVEDAGSDNFLSSLLESNSLVPLQGKPDLTELVPVDLTPALTKQPLWLYR